MASELPEAAQALLAAMTPTVGRTIIVRVSLIMVFTGLILSLTLYSLYTFLRTPPSLRRGRWPYLALSLVLAALHIVVASFDAHFAFLALLPSPSSSSPSSPQAQGALGIQNMLAKNAMDSCYREWITVCIWGFLVLSTALVDGLMLYRCWVVFGGSTRRWVVAIPGVVYVAGIALGLTQLLVWCPSRLFTVLNTAWFGSSVLFNVLVTSLITTRLVLANRAFARALGGASTAVTQLGPKQKSTSNSGEPQYTQVWAMLVEAAVPPAVMGVLYAVFALWTNLGVSAVDDLSAWMRMYVSIEVVQCLYFEFSVLAPVMVIFRVTTGRSFTHAIGDQHQHHPHRPHARHEDSSASHVFSKPLAFASSAHSGDSDFDLSYRDYDLEKGGQKDFSSASEASITEIESPISPVAESPITDNELSPIEEVPRGP